MAHYLTFTQVLSSLQLYCFLAAFTRSVRAFEGLFEKLLLFVTPMSTHILSNFERISMYHHYQLQLHLPENCYRLVLFCIFTKKKFFFSFVLICIFRHTLALRVTFHSVMKSKSNPIYFVFLSRKRISREKSRPVFGSCTWAVLLLRRRLAYYNCCIGACILFVYTHKKHKWR